MEQYPDTVRAADYAISSRQDITDTAGDTLTMAPVLPGFAGPVVDIYALQPPFRA
jgi:hypothetical protein